MKFRSTLNCLFSIVCLILETFGMFTHDCYVFWVNNLYLLNGYIAQKLSNKIPK